MEDKNTIISCDTHVFLVTFQHRTAGNRFIVNSSFSLMEVLKNAEKLENKKVESIKVLDTSKQSFKRISKADILKFCSFDTEPYLYLKQHYYFK